MASQTRTPNYIDASGQHGPMVAAYVQVQGDNYYADIWNGGDHSAALYASSFGFSIPAGRTIQNITLNYVENQYGDWNDNGWSVPVAANETPATVNSSGFGVSTSGWASNEGGKLIDLISVTVTYSDAPPEAPTCTTTQVSSITHNSANGGGNVTHNGNDACTAGVVWATHSAPIVTGGTPDDHTHDATDEGAFASVLATLLPSTTYYYRAYVTNSITTAYGAEYNFQTTAMPVNTMLGAIGRTTLWKTALSAAQILAAYQEGQMLFERSTAKGTVTIEDVVKNRQGAVVPATHVRAGWWVQNLDKGTTEPLFITAHSVDLAGGRNALTVGRDWMEDEIGVRMSELLALPATPEPEEPEPETPETGDDGETPYNPGDYA